MGDFSFGELFVILVIAIMIYGKDLPKAARKLAQVYNKLRRQITDLRDEIQRQIPMDELRTDLLSEGPVDPIDPPPPPTGLSAHVSGGVVQLSWDSSPGATGYNVKRSAGAQEPLVNLVMDYPDLSYTDSEVSEGGTYHYCISATNRAGESGNSEEVVVTVGASAPAPAPPPAGGNGAASPGVPEAAEKNDAPPTPP